MNFRYFAFALFTAVLTLQCTHPSEEEVDQNLNEKIAGSYEGQFQCANYGGPVAGWTVVESAGALELMALGQDSLRLAVGTGCLYDTYRFKYDSAVSIGKSYDFWRGDTPYGQIRSWGDSVWVSVPRPSSYGWLSSDFKGKKK